MVEGGHELDGSGELGGRLEIPKSDEPLDWCGCPLAVSTVIVRAFGYKYNPPHPESMIAVWSLWLR